MTPKVAPQHERHHGRSPGRYEDGAHDQLQIFNPLQDARSPQNLAHDGVDVKAQLLTLLPVKHTVSPDTRTLCPSSVLYAVARLRGDGSDVKRFIAKEGVAIGYAQCVRPKRVDIVAYLALAELGQLVLDPIHDLVADACDRFATSVTSPAFRL